jgi:hypothetical protein
LEPDQHGIAGWVKPPQDGKTELYYSDDRTGWALWNILSANGMSAEIVNWLITYPPPVIDGVVVSDHTFASDVKGKQYLGKVFARSQNAELAQVKSAASGSAAVFPKSWVDRVQDEKHLRTLLPDHPDMFEQPGAVAERFDQEWLSNFYEQDNRLVSVALDVEAELSPRLMMILLQGIDRVSHKLWACLEDPETYPEGFELSPSERAACHAALVAYYEYTDALIGEMMSRFRPSDLVVIVSDHGFEPFFEGQNTGGHATDAARDGVLFVRGRGIEPGARSSELTVIDVVPTILRWLGLAQAEDLRGSPAGFVTSYPDPPDPVPTYNSGEIVRVGAERSGTEERLLEALGELGYVD